MTLLKRYIDTGAFLELFWGILKNTFFTEHLRETSFVVKNQNIQDDRFRKPNFVLQIHLYINSNLQIHLKATIVWWDEEITS